MGVDVFFVCVLRCMEIFAWIGAHYLFDKSDWIVGVGGVRTFRKTRQFVHFGADQLQNLFDFSDLDAVGDNLKRHIIDRANQLHGFSHVAAR
ncbi:MAG: hypothetical protein BWY75_03711 [bacterium ADurb.Bin425]|nr:MAG: hypothetical protein BWY75_03711 [bacterium ADurb.Bin425]